MLIGQLDTSKPITELPLCPGCDKEKGWVWCFGQFLCGDCVVKYMKIHHQKQIDYLKQMKEETKNE